MEQTIIIAKLITQKFIQGPQRLILIKIILGHCTV